MTKDYDVELSRIFICKREEMSVQEKASVEPLEDLVAADMRQCGFDPERLEDVQNYWEKFLPSSRMRCEALQLSGLKRAPRQAEARPGQAPIDRLLALRFAAERRAAHDERNRFMEGED